jgi:hypothetical protein
VCRHRPRPLPGGPHCRASDRLNSVGWCAAGLDRPTSPLFAGSPPADGKTDSTVSSCRDRRGWIRRPGDRIAFAVMLAGATSPKPRSPPSGFSRCWSSGRRRPRRRLPHARRRALNHRMRVWTLWRPPRRSDRASAAQDQAMSGMQSGESYDPARNGLVSPRCPAVTGSNAQPAQGFAAIACQGTATDPCRVDDSKSMASHPTRQRADGRSWLGNLSAGLGHRPASSSFSAPPSLYWPSSWPWRSWSRRAPIPARPVRR